jgi:hypothetical protein
MWKSIFNKVKTSKSWIQCHSPCSLIVTTILPFSFQETIGNKYWVLDKTKYKDLIN